MSSQEDWSDFWNKVFLGKEAQMNDTDDKNAVWELNQTMIYTAQQAKALADESVALAEASAKAAAEREGKPNEPLSEDEKARLWRAVMESCSG